MFPLRGVVGAATTPKPGPTRRAVLVRARTGRERLARGGGAVDSVPGTSGKVGVDQGQRGPDLFGGGEGVVALRHWSDGVVPPFTERLGRGLGQDQVTLKQKNSHGFWGVLKAGVGNLTPPQPLRLRIVN